MCAWCMRCMMAYARGLSESAILRQGPDGSMRVEAIVDPSEDTTRERISADTLRRLRAGEEVVASSSQTRTEAVTPIDRAAGVYLYIARDANRLAFSQWQRAQSVIQSYDILGRQARTLQLNFNLMLFGVSLA